MTASVSRAAGEWQTPTIRPELACWVLPARIKMAKAVAYASWLVMARTPDRLQCLLHCYELFLKRTDCRFYKRLVSALGDHLIRAA